MGKKRRMELLNKRKGGVFGGHKPKAPKIPGLSNMEEIRKRTREALKNSGKKNKGIAWTIFKYTLITIGVLIPSGGMGSLSLCAGQGILYFMLEFFTRQPQGRRTEASSDGIFSQGLTAVGLKKRKAHGHK